MRIAYFTQSLISCWNQGNAHFQRGLLRALGSLGHKATAWEPSGSWSRENLLLDQGAFAEQAFFTTYPDLDVQTYDPLSPLDGLVASADIVIVHEWTEPEIVAAIGDLREQYSFTLLFHDTHHRAVSDPDAIRRYDLSRYDGVLAFGAALAEIYRGWGWGERVFVWHEAADTTLFKPPAEPIVRSGAVWIGNWGDGERTAELEKFLLAPARDCNLPLDIYGVRYPDQALTMLEAYGARYHGWIGNAAAPGVFARHAMTVHVPRRFYTEALPGIPTIRVFEALACGIPLITAPWPDSESLFDPGTDFLVAQDAREMRQHMSNVANDPELASDLVDRGLSRILAHHTCDIRAVELLAIVDKLANHSKVAA